MIQSNRFVSSNGNAGMKSPINAKTQVITPAIASQLIADSADFRNRNLSSTVVRNYCDQMKHGLWKSNGETIVIDQEGAVINGQHRLHAIVMAGVSVELLVVRGVERSTFSTLDKGRKRVSGDVLFVAGYTETRGLAATINSVYSYLIDGVFVNARSGSARNVSPMIVEFIEEYPMIVISQKYISVASKKMAWLTPPSAMGALHYLFGLADRNRRDTFFDEFVKNQSSTGHPVHTLIQSHSSRQIALLMKASLEVRAALWIKAWNSYVRGEEIHVLRYSPENHTFPAIQGLDRLAIKSHIERHFQGGR
jgi:hypothetical protein